MFKKGSVLFNSLAVFAILAFTATLLFVDLFRAKTSVAAVTTMPAPTAMVPMSKAYDFAVLRGLKLDPQNPFDLEFVVDYGSAGKTDRETAARLVRYFLATLTTPESKIWVNLSPYEEDRVIEDSLGTMEMGRDLLEQDYMLKQLSSSLTHPETDVGRDYWQKTYEEMAAKFGDTQLPVNTFNKIWIVPSKAELYEHGNGVIITDARLDAQLEQDFLASEKNAEAMKGFSVRAQDGDAAKMNEITKKIMKEYVLPAVVKDVNEGQNFATLRQIYHAQILATWFKKKLKDSMFAAYLDKEKTAGLNKVDEKKIEQIYGTYVQAFKRGVYDMVKAERDPVSEKNVRRHYFSGGYDLNGLANKVTASSIIVDRAKKVLEKTKNGMLKVVLMGAMVGGMVFALPNTANGQQVSPAVEQTAPQAAHEDEAKPLDQKALLAAHPELKDAFVLRVFRADGVERAAVFWSPNEGKLYDGDHIVGIQKHGSDVIEDVDIVVGDPEKAEKFAYNNVVSFELNQTVSVRSKAYIAGESVVPLKDLGGVQQQFQKIKNIGTIEESMVKIYLADGTPISPKKGYHFVLNADGTAVQLKNGSKAEEKFKTPVLKEQKKDTVQAPKEIAKAATSETKTAKENKYRKVTKLGDKQAVAKADSVKKVESLAKDQVPAEVRTFNIGTDFIVKVAKKDAGGNFTKNSQTKKYIAKVSPYAEGDMVQQALITEVTYETSDGKVHVLSFAPGSVQSISNGELKLKANADVLRETVGVTGSETLAGVKDPVLTEKLSPADTMQLLKNKFLNRKNSAAKDSVAQVTRDSIPARVETEHGRKFNDIPGVTKDPSLNQHSRLNGVSMTQPPRTDEINTPQTSPVIDPLATQAQDSTVQQPNDTATIVDPMAQQAQDTTNTNVLDPEKYAAEVFGVPGSQAGDTLTAQKDTAVQQQVPATTMDLMTDLIAQYESGSYKKSDSTANDLAAREAFLIDVASVLGEAEVVMGEHENDTAFHDAYQKLRVIMSAAEQMQTNTSAQVMLNDSAYAARFMQAVEKGQNPVGVVKAYTQQDEQLSKNENYKPLTDKNKSFLRALESALEIPFKKTPTAAAHDLEQGRRAHEIFQGQIAGSNKQATIEASKRAPDMLLNLYKAGMIGTNVLPSVDSLENLVAQNNAKIAENEKAKVLYGDSIRYQEGLITAYTDSLAHVDSLPGSDVPPASYTQRLDSLNFLVSTLQAQAAALNNERDSLGRANAALADEQNNLRAQRDSLENLQDILRQGIQPTLDSIAVLQDSLSSFANQRQALQGLYASLQDSLNNLQDPAANADSVNVWKQQLTNVQTILDEMAADEQRLRAERLVVNAQIAEYQKYYADAQDAADSAFIKELIDVQDGLLSAIDEQLAIVDGYKEERAILQGKLLAAFDTTATEQRRAELEAQMRGILDAIAALDGKMQAAQGKIDDLNARIRGIQAQIAALQTQMDQIDDVIALIGLEIAANEARMREIAAELAFITEQLLDLAQKIKDAQDLINNYKGEKIPDTERISYLQSMIGEANVKIQEYQQRIFELTDENARLADENERLRSDEERLQAINKDLTAIGFFKKAKELADKNASIEEYYAASLRMLMKDRQKQMIENADELEATARFVAAIEALKIAQKEDGAFLKDVDLDALKKAVLRQARKDNTKIDVAGQGYTSKTGEYVGAAVEAPVDNQGHVNVIANAGAHKGVARGAYTNAGLKLGTNVVSVGPATFQANVKGTIGSDQGHVEGIDLGVIAEKATRTDSTRGLVIGDYSKLQTFMKLGASADMALRLRLSEQAVLVLATEYFLTMTPKTNIFGDRTYQDKIMGGGGLLRTEFGGLAPEFTYMRYQSDYDGTLDPKLSPDSLNIDASNYTGRRTHDDVGVNLGMTSQLKGGALKINLGGEVQSFKMTENDSLIKGGMRGVLQSGLQYRLHDFSGDGFAGFALNAETGKNIDGKGGKPTLMLMPAVTFKFYDPRAGGRASFVTVTGKYGRGEAFEYDDRIVQYALGISYETDGFSLGFEFGKKPERAAGKVTYAEVKAALTIGRTKPAGMADGSQSETVDAGLKLTKTEMLTLVDGIVQQNAHVLYDRETNQWIRSMRDNTDGGKLKTDVLHPQAAADTLAAATIYLGSAKDSASGFVFRRVLSSSHDIFEVVRSKDDLQNKNGVMVEHEGEYVPAFPMPAEWNGTTPNGYTQIEVDGKRMYTINTPFSLQPLGANINEGLDYVYEKDTNAQYMGVLVTEPSDIEYAKTSDVDEMIESMRAEIEKIAQEKRDSGNADPVTLADLKKNNILLRIADAPFIPENRAGADGVGKFDKYLADKFGVNIFDGGKALIDALENKVIKDFDSRAKGSLSQSPNFKVVANDSISYVGKDGRKVIENYRVAAAPAAGTNDVKYALVTNDNIRLTMTVSASQPIDSVNIFFKMMLATGKISAKEQAGLLNVIDLYPFKMEAGGAFNKKDYPQKQLNTFTAADRLISLYSRVITISGKKYMEYVYVDDADPTKALLKITPAPMTKMKARQMSDILEPYKGVKEAAQLDKEKSKQLLKEKYGKSSDKSNDKGKKPDAFGLGADDRRAKKVGNSAIKNGKDDFTKGGIALDKVEALIKTSGTLNIKLPEIDISKIDGLTFTITAFAPTTPEKVLASL